MTEEYQKVSIEEASINPKLDGALVEVRGAVQTLYLQGSPYLFGRICPLMGEKSFLEFLAATSEHDDIRCSSRDLALLRESYQYKGGTFACELFLMGKLSSVSGGGNLLNVESVRSVEGCLENNIEDGK